MKIVNLDDCRQMLAQIEELRGQILRGELSGISCCVRRIDGEEIVNVAGVYRRDSKLSMRAALQLSWLLQREKRDLDPMSGSTRR